MVTQLRHVLVQQVDAVVELVLLAALQVEREPVESSKTSLRHCADVTVRVDGGVHLGILQRSDCVPRQDRMMGVAAM